MKYALFMIGIGSLALVSGCTSGNTYGTGTSHEEQTFRSLTSILSFKKDKGPDIDYSARPDLVMPADKQTLPSPQDTAEAEDANWPVSPEERIAAIRAAAPEADERSGELSVEYLTSEKEGIRKTSSHYGNTLRQRRNDKDGGSFIEEMRRDAAGRGTNEKVRKAREQLAYSSGPRRKYLVEPPAEYRIPAATAEAGSVGIDETELSRQEKENKRKERQNDIGMWTE